MNRSRLIYYVGFPLLMILLCGLSYYLGYHRGQQGKSLEAPKSMSTKEVHEPSQDLTFFKKLKEEAPEPKFTSQPASAASQKTEQKKETKSRAEVSGKIVIQVSAFKEVGRAHELIDVLKNKGFQAFGKHGRRGQQDFYRVYVGPFSTQAKAQAEGKRLAAQGFPDHFLTKAPQE